MRISKRSIGISICGIALIGIGISAYLLLSAVDKRWKDDTSWQMSENIHVPYYDPDKIKISQATNQVTSEAAIDVDYCLLLNSVNEQDKITLRCSLIPYLYGILQLYDPYSWKPETGISITFDRASFVTPVSYIGKQNKTFDDIATTGQYLPVSLHAKYSYTKPQASFINKVKHYFNTRDGKAEVIPQQITNWEVSKIKSFSELSENEKAAFKQEWKKAAQSDIVSLYSFDSLSSKNGQELIDAFSQLIRNETFVCNVESDETSCRLTGPANPAEPSMYLSYIDKSAAISKIFTEIQRRLFPFSPRTSPDVYTCGDKGPRDDCSKWSQFQVYQLPICPITELTDKTVSANETLFLKYYADLDPNATIKLADVQKFSAAYLKNPGLEDPDHLHLLQSVDALCKNIIQSKVTDTKSIEGVVPYYYSIAFHDAQVWSIEKQGGLIKPSQSNLLELLYISYMYSPYKYHLLQDGSLITKAATAGYSNARLESTLGYSYNLYASWVALYLLQ